MTGSRGEKRSQVEAAHVDEEKEAIERTRKLRTEIEEHMEEKPKRKKQGKKKSA